MKRLLILGALLLPLPASAQGFDCRNITSRDEVRICDSGKLSRLDSKLNAAYHRALARIDSDYIRSRVVRDQRRWLASRRRCGGRWGCLESMYQQRIAELRAY